MKNANVVTSLAAMFNTGTTMQALPYQQQQGAFDWLTGGGNPAPAIPDATPSATPNTEAEGDDPAKQAQPDGQPPANTNKQENPLDIFAGMFDTKQDEQDSAPEFSLDPSKLTEAAGKLDFTSNISQDDLSAMQNGDMEAIMRVMQTMQRNTYSTALQHASALTNQFVNSRSEYDRKSTPSLVRDALTSSELSENGGQLPDTVKKGLAETARRLAKVHPDASPKEIANMSRRYFAENTAAMLGISGAELRSMLEQNQQKQQSAPKEIDWEAEFS